MTRYVPTELTLGDRLAALTASLAVAAGAGVVTYYLARIVLAREEVDEAGDPAALRPTSPRRRIGAGET